MMKKLPELLEDMLARSTSPRMSSTEANDAINLMEVFGEPPTESSTLGALRVRNRDVRPRHSLRGPIDGREVDCERNSAVR